MTAKVYKTDGTIAEVTPANGTDFTLDELRIFINGSNDPNNMVELLHLPEHYLICDEEGKLKHLPVNETATEIFQSAGYADVIVGTVLICDKSMVK